MLLPLVFLNGLDLGNDRVVCLAARRCTQMNRAPKHGQSEAAKEQNRNGSQPRQWAAPSGNHIEGMAKVRISGFTRQSLHPTPLGLNVTSLLGQDSGFKIKHGRVGTSHRSNPA